MTCPCLSLWNKDINRVGPLQEKTCLLREKHLRMVTPSFLYVIDFEKYTKIVKYFLNIVEKMFWMLYNKNIGYINYKFRTT